MCVFAYVNADHSVKTYRIELFWEGVFLFFAYLISVGVFIQMPKLTKTYAKVVEIL